MTSDELATVVQHLARIEENQSVLARDVLSLRVQVDRLMSMLDGSRSCEEPLRGTRRLPKERSVAKSFEYLDDGSPNVLGMYNEKQRLDGGRVAEHLGVPLRVLCVAFGLNYQRVWKSSSSQDIQNVLEPLKEVLETLTVQDRSPARARAWLHTLHAELGGVKPIEVLMRGEFSKVLSALGGPKRWPRRK